MLDTEGCNTDTYYTDMESVWASTYPSITSVEEYEAFYADTTGRTVSDFVAELMSHVSIERGRLLDYGCDNGIMLNFFRDYGVELYGVDINAEALAQGRKLFPDLDLRKNDGIEIPFDEHFFDLVFAGGVLKHIRPDDRPKLYDEFERVAANVMVWEENAEEPHAETWGGFTFYKANFEVELDARFARVHQIKAGNQLFGVYATALTK